MRPHQKLIAWQTAIEFVNDIYLTTMDFPSTEKFGIVSQIRRAAVSVCANIAEGSARYSKKEKVQFNYIAAGSLSEIETLLIISKNLNYISELNYNNLINKGEKTSALVDGLIRLHKKQIEE